MDLRNYALRPNYYCLRHGTRYGTQYSLRNWRLEGSQDASSWTTLRNHTSDAALNSDNATAGWTLQSQQAYRYFRVYNWGKAKGNCDHLMCSGMELYGELKQEL